jgi:dephospho-CoA kinase
MKRPLLVGITGGIGSGKSIVCMVFRHLGVPIFEADLVAKNLINNDKGLKNQIISLLGTSAYLPDGTYNKGWVASQVMANISLLTQLNQLIHPAVRAQGLQWATQHIDAPFLLYEAALIKPSDPYFDRVIVVTAPVDIRIQRVQKRDGRSVESIRQIMDNQLLDKEWIVGSDFVIDNDGQKSLLDQVYPIFKQLNYEQKTN